MRRATLPFLLTALLWAGTAYAVPRQTAASAEQPRQDFDWNLVTGEAEWGGRAGLQAVRLGSTFYVLGGRTPRPPGYPPIPGDSDIWGDVWRSDDDGRTWKQILETNDQEHWPARAYFQAVTMRGHMYVIGGQNFRVIPNPGCPDPTTGCPPFVSSSEFFDDVWRSGDGVKWERLTDAPGWEGRAGLSAAAFKGHLYVFGGSRNDDDAIIGGPPQRLYFNDVWRSRDGARWERVTGNAPWSPRAGAAVTVKNGYLYLLGGEAGFLCAPQPCQLPYFNDVWRTRDGVRWELVTNSAGFSPRPGHQCVTIRDRIVCFGGFGLPVNPIDMVASRDGRHWTTLPDAAWDAVSPDQGKYDFDALAVPGVPGLRGPAIFTFGGDRETFDFTDPGNYLRVDDEVWRYSPCWPGVDMPEEFMLAAEELEGEETVDAGAASPPVAASRVSLTVTGAGLAGGPMTLSFSLPAAAEVRLGVYDVSGRLVRELVSESVGAGVRSVTWDAAGADGRRVAAGVYFARLTAGGERRTATIVRMP